MRLNPCEKIFINYFRRNKMTSDKEKKLEEKLEEKAKTLAAEAAKKFESGSKNPSEYSKFLEALVIIDDRLRLSASGRFDVAVEVYRKGVELCPDSPQMNLNLAEALCGQIMRTAELDKAKELHEKVLEYAKNAIEKAKLEEDISAEVHIKEAEDFIKLADNNLSSLSTYSHKKGM